MKKVLITGAGGQLGFELQRTAPQGWQIIALGSGALDIQDAAATAAAVQGYAPALIVNAAAYTAVDKAETEPQRAYGVNAHGAANLASAAVGLGARLIHVSTDFVFDGEKSCPYLPTDRPNPLGVYGASKLEGERRVDEITAGDALILRTAWVYSAHGNNFVKTILRLARERDSLRVISEQVGTPTWANGLAQVIWAAADQPALKGIYHWTDSGVASWYDFAVAIVEEAVSIGLLNGAVPVFPIRAVDYPLPAARPPYSVLDKTATLTALNLTPRHWRVMLREMLEDLKEMESASPDARISAGFADANVRHQPRE
jgi:dTDP-4-dehydrorhamnose reductase